MRSTLLVFCLVGQAAFAERNLRGAHGLIAEDYGQAEHEAASVDNGSDEERMAQFYDAERQLGMYSGPRATVSFFSAIGLRPLVLSRLETQSDSVVSSVVPDFLVRTGPTTTANSTCSRGRPTTTIPTTASSKCSRGRPRCITTPTTVNCTCSLGRPTTTTRRATTAS